LISIKESIREGAWEIWKYKSMLGHVTPDWDMMSDYFKKAEKKRFEMWFDEEES